jgi:hypothetical protein
MKTRYTINKEKCKNLVKIDEYARAIAQVKGDFNWTSNKMGK